MYKRVRLPFVLPAVFLCLGLLLACGSDDSEIDDGLVNSFPLKEGASWTYQYYTDDPDVPEGERQRTVRITIAGKAQINEVETYLFETTTYEEPDLVSLHYYRQADNQMLLAAYKLAANSYANARMRDSSAPYFLHSIAAEGGQLHPLLVIEEPPRIVYDYPLVVGKTWTHWEKDGKVLITKEVVAKERVTVQSGTFQAYKVVNEGDWYDSTGIEMIDFVANVGLVKRHIGFDFALAGENGEPIDEKRITITVELQAYEE